MFVVVFKAKVGKQNTEYDQTVAKMRDLAFEKYGCLDFVALTQGKQEIAISYWPDEASIIKWKNDTEHQLAQTLGRASWYDSYTVEVLELKRQYSFDSTKD